MVPAEGFEPPTNGLQNPPPHPPQPPHPPKPAAHHPHTPHPPPTGPTRANPINTTTGKKGWKFLVCLKCRAREFTDASREHGCGAGSGHGARDRRPAAGRGRRALVRLYPLGLQNRSSPPTPYDPGCLLLPPARYYPYYNSGYWRPLHTWRKPNRDSLVPPYYQAWATRSGATSTAPGTDTTTAATAIITGRPRAGARAVPRVPFATFTSSPSSIAGSGAG